MLKDRWPDVPIVVVTGLDRPGLAEDMIAAGAMAFLGKPVSKDQLAPLLGAPDQS
jgi:DNA-binding NarL/FixJ family response regulator